jgi:hypothetical protein
MMRRSVVMLGDLLWGRTAVYQVLHDESPEHVVDSSHVSTSPRLCAKGLCSQRPTKPLCMPGEPPHYLFVVPHYSNVVY